MTVNTFHSPKIVIFYPEETRVVSPSFLLAEKPSLSLSEPELKAAIQKSFDSEYKPMKHLLFVYAWDNFEGYQVVERGSVDQEEVDLIDQLKIETEDIDTQLQQKI